LVRRDGDRPCWCAPAAVSLPTEIEANLFHAPVSRRTPQRFCSADGTRRSVARSIAPASLRHRRMEQVRFDLSRQLTVPAGTKTITVAPTKVSGPVMNLRWVKLVKPAEASKAPTPVTRTRTFPPVFLRIAEIEKRTTRRCRRPSSYPSAIASLLFAFQYKLLSPHAADIRPRFQRRPPSVPVCGLGHEAGARTPAPGTSVQPARNN